MNIRNWEVRPLDKDRAAALAQAYNIPFFLAMLLNIRGVDRSEEIEAFLGAGAPLSDPFLLKDMDRAASASRGRSTRWRRSPCTATTTRTA